MDSATRYGLYVPETTIATVPTLEHRPVDDAHSRIYRPSLHHSCLRSHGLLKLANLDMWRYLPRCRGESSSFDKKSTRRPRRLYPERQFFWAYMPLEATMKHLKGAASVVNLAIFVSCSISCSSGPPPSPGAAGRAMLAPHLPRAVANGQAAMMGDHTKRQRRALADQCGSESIDGSQRRRR